MTLIATVLAGRFAIRSAVLPLCVIGLGLPGNATAQLAPGVSGFSDAPRAGLPDEFWFALSDFGSCLALGKPALARSFLATTPGTEAEAIATKALIGKESACMRHAYRMRLSTRLLRGFVAEKLYERVQPAAPPVSLTANAVAVKSDEVAGDPYALLASFAGCFVARQPLVVHDLLTKTRPASKAEAVMLDNASASFTSCLPAKVKLGFQAPEIRSYLAEAAYQRTLPSQYAVGQR